MGEIIWNKINWINVVQDTENQYLEVAKQPTCMSNIGKIYISDYASIRTVKVGLDGIRGLGSS